MITITTDQAKINMKYVHQYLSGTSYWAMHIPLETFKRSVENSLCFTILKNEKQIGFARMITDKATFCYLCDVFIDECERGHGYSKMLMEYIMSYPDLQGLRRYMLGTADAHGLYKQFGFTELSAPERIMEIKNNNVYPAP